MSPNTFIDYLRDVNFQNHCLKNCPKRYVPLLTRYVATPLCPSCKQSLLDALEGLDPDGLVVSFKASTGQLPCPPERRPGPPAKTSAAGIQVEIDPTEEAYRKLIKEMAAKHTWSGMSTSMVKGRWVVRFS